MDVFKTAPYIGMTDEDDLKGGFGSTAVVNSLVYRQIKIPNEGKLGMFIVRALTCS